MSDELDDFALDRKDRTDLRDRIDVGLIDESRCDQLSEPLAARLKHLLENPGG